jgi:nucleoid DNA-binding protein
MTALAPNVAGPLLLPRPPRSFSRPLAARTMTKAELIEKIARSRDLPEHISKKDLAAVLTIAFEELKGYFVRAKVTRSQQPRFSVPNFGTFSKKRRRARRGVNPRTLEPMDIEACYTLDFRASRELREALNAAAEAAAGRPRAKEAASEADGEVPAKAPKPSKVLEALPAAPLMRVRASSKPRQRSAG